LGERDVHIGYPAAVVCRELKVGVSPSEANIRVMIGRLGQCTHSVHKFHGGGEILEFEMPAELVLLDRPVAIERLHCGREGITTEQFSVHIVNSDRSTTLRYTKCF